MKREIIAAVCSVAISVGATCWGFWNNNLEVGLYIAIAAITLGQTVSLLITSSNMKGTINALKKPSPVSSFDSVDEAWNYIFKRLHKLDVVNNTVFDLANPTPPKLARLINNEKGLSWKDIGDKSAEERFEKLGSIEKYERRIISSGDIQLINFIILNYKAKYKTKKEVIFNWPEGSKVEADNPILLSQDETITKMFF